MRGRFGGFQRQLLATVLALAGVSLLSVCADVNAPAGQRPGHVAFAPALSSASAHALGASSTVVDNVHIVIRALDGTIVLDRVVVFPDGADEVSITADIPVHGESERFQATIQLRSGDVVLFEGTQDLDVQPGQQQGPPASVPVTYVGTGSNATTVTIAPGGLELSSNGSSPLVATVRDANGNVIQNVPLGWTSSDENVATVSDDGVVTAKAVRGTATITASTFGGVTGTSSAHVTLPPSQLRVAGGGAQTGRVGEGLPIPFVVELLASDGVGVPNATVSFSTNNPGASISPATATTDATGRASASITLGTAAGPQSFSASAASFGANISATALAGEANRITIASGDAQSGLTGAALSSPLTVKVTDEFGNPGAGRQVSWTALSGGTVGGVTTTTNAAGVATNTFTLPVTAGQVSIQAALSIGGSVVFSATALPRPASSLTATSGTPQSGNVGTATQPLVVRVFDALNQPVANASVVWSVTGTATIGNTTSTTNASGFANITGNFGPIPGASTVTATVAGAGNVIFALTTVVGPPATIELVAGEGQTAAPGNAVPIPPAVRVLDAFGNPVAGITVTFGGASSGGSVTGPNQVTDANGIATVGSWILGGFAPPQTMTATAGPLTATFHATATSAVVLHLVPISGNAQAGPAGTPLPAPMLVEVRDTANIPIVGVSVQFTVTLGGGTPASQTIVSDANGRAGFTLTLGAPGPQSVTACIVPGCTSVQAFGATATAPGTTRTWTGATSNNWTVASNWSPAIVPTALDDVVIPSGTPNSPFLFGAVTINKLGVGPAAVLNLNGFPLTVAGDLSSVGATIVGGTVRMTGAANTLTGTVTALTIDAGAVITASGAVSITGPLVIQNASTLDVGANTVTVGGAFDVTGAGSHLKTTNAAGALVVSGTATFNGADMAGVDLTAGLLDLKGNFVANGTNGSQAFHAAGAHLTRFSGVASQSITFAVPGAGSSTFANVAITNLSGAGVTLSASNAFVSGAMNQDGRLTVASPRTLTIAGALTLGTASTTTVAAGATITSGSCTPLGGASFSGFACGGSATTWLGGTSNDWNTPANWSPAAVPIATTDVVVPAGTPNSITLTSNATTKNFTVANGATVNMGVATIFIGGNVTTTGASFTGGGAFNMTGAGVTLAGNVPNLTIAGTTTLAGTTSVTGNVTIAGGSVLSIGSSAMTIGANLSVDPINGRLKMTNPAATLTVNGTATFDGSEMGDLDLTAGLLDLKGDFVATGLEFQSFRATGTHITRFSGTGAQSISMAFASNTQSRFQELQIQNSSASGVTLSSNVYVAGNVAQNGRASLGTSLSWTIAGALTLGATSTTTVTGGSVIAGSCTPISGASFSGFTCGGTFITWLGGTSSNFNTGSNWSGGLVPLSSQNVVVPSGTTFSILLTGTVAMNDFTLMPGATFNTAGNQVQIGRNVDIGGTLVGGGQMLMTPIAGTMVGSFPLDVEISAGPVTVTGGTLITGNLTVQGGGVLNMGTSSLTINGNLDLTGAANLKMNDADAVLVVIGNASFAGGDMGNTDLTAGQLEIHGNFLASPSAQGFRAVGGHITRFSGSTPQSINFFSPGDAASRFQNLQFDGGNTVTFIGNVYAAGTTAIGNNTTLTSGSNCCILFVSGPVSSTAGTNLGGLNRIEVYGGAGAILPEIAGVGPPAIHLNSGTTITSGTTPLTIPSTLRIFSSGTILDVAAHTITVTGDFSYQTGGAFSMTNAAGHLIVNNNLSGDDVDMGDVLLTAGVLDIKGNISLGANGTQIFRATGTHTTRLIGTTGIQSLIFNTAGVTQSRFQNLEITNSVAGITLSSNAHVQGTLRQAGLLNVPNTRVLTINGLLTLESGSITSVFGTLTPAGGCVNNGGSVAGFTC